VGTIVAERIGRARLFERLGIDYCCQGRAPLAEACAARALDVGRVVEQIAESDAADTAAGAGGEDRVDFAAMTASALADHVEATHHAYLRRELPRLTALIDKVAAAHGARHPELADLHGTFAGLRSELEQHMMKEERVLFPLVRRLEGATEPFPIFCGSVENPIRVMCHEHDDAGAALDRLRELSHGYQPPADACATYCTLYDGLAALEADLRRHIHKENNILFPKAAELEAALAGAGH
jgi:regulator of cell morphogenesis and NO signaling